MGRKCCIYGCKTNYESEKKGYVTDGDKIPVFRFPSEKTDPDELWHNLSDKEARICELESQVEQLQLAQITFPLLLRRVFQSPQPELWCTTSDER